MNRLTAMRVIAWLLTATGVGFGLFTVVFGIVGPDQEIHAVHNAIVASLLIVLTAPPMVAVARAPERAIRPLVILAVLAVAGLAAMALALTPDPFILPVLVLIGVLWWLAPAREGAVPPGRPSLPMLAFVLAGAVLLLPYAIDNAGLQRTDHTSDHAAFYHWVESSFTAAGIVLVGLLAALRPAGVPDGDMVRRPFARDSRCRIGAVRRLRLGACLTRELGSAGRRARVHRCRRMGGPSPRLGVLTPYVRPRTLKAGTGLLRPFSMRSGIGSASTAASTAANNRWLMRI